MTRWHVFHSWSIIFRNWEYFFVNIPEKQLIISVFRLDYWTEVLMKWGILFSGNMIFRVRMYKNKPTWGGSNQTYMIRNATKSAVFAATDSGPGNANLNLCEAICAHHWMSKMKQTTARQILEKKKRKRREGSPGYTPAGSLRLWCWPQKCAKKETGWQNSLWA